MFISLTDSIDHQYKKNGLLTDRIDLSAEDFFLLTTIDLVNDFCRQLIISIDPTNVFFGHQCPPMLLGGIFNFQVTNRKDSEVPSCS
jgi:hypothetical protein